MLGADPGLLRHLVRLKGWQLSGRAIKTFPTSAEGG